jgi:Antitoxin ParD
MEGILMRLSLEVTPEQHQRLKAVAALRGQTIKDYVLNRVLPETPTDDENEALRQLEAFLEPRILAAQEDVKKSVKQIFEETHREMR